VANRKLFGTLLAGVDHLPATYDRSQQAFTKGEPEYGAHFADELERIVALHDASTIAAVIVEPMAGSTGVLPAPKGYLQRLRQICDKHGILLILDEVMAGWGRTGRWFGCDHWDVVPDIICVAKGINSGYVPLGAMIINQKLADWVEDKYFAGGLTYSGHILACASAIASIEAFQEEGIVENSAAMGEVLGAGLKALMEKHPSIGEVRGKGLFWGIELVKDRETREPLVPFNATGEAFAPVARLAKAAMERGVYLMTHWNVIICAPPLTITRDELDEALGVLDEVLSLVD
jgi:taurine---2-oxoglutarate transaminase